MILSIIILTCLISVLAFRTPELLRKLAMSYYEVVHRYELYRLVSHMFVHGSFSHLAINMIVFYSFGKAVLFEFYDLTTYDLVHSPRALFLWLYLGGGITSALLSLLFRRNREIMSVGASGGVSSLIFTSIFFDPWSSLYIFGLVPLPGILLGVGYLIYSWYMARKGQDNIDHHAHFFGALYGLLFPMVAIDPHLYFVFLNKLLLIE